MFVVTTHNSSTFTLVFHEERPAVCNTISERKVTSATQHNTTSEVVAASLDRYRESRHSQIVVTIDRGVDAVLDPLQVSCVDCGNHILGTHNSSAALCDLCHSAKQQLASFSAVLSA